MTTEAEININQSESHPLVAMMLRRKYNKDYYHEHKTPAKCEHCDSQYSCLSGLRKHQARRKKCMVNKLQKYIAELEGKSPSDIALKRMASHMVTELQ